MKHQQSPYRIQELTPDLLEDALELVERVFMRFEAPDYSEEGIESFKDFIQLDTITDAAINGTLKFWGCFHAHKIVGVIAQRGIGHICLLFVDKEYHYRGIGRMLFDTFVDDVKKHPEVEKLTVNASPYSVGFYHKMGFRDTEPEKVLNGIRHTPMAQDL